MSWYSSTSTWSKRVAEVGGDGAVLHHPGPVEEEVVIVEDGLALLGLDIGGEEIAQVRSRP